MSATEFTVELAPAGQTFKVGADETILDAALRQGVELQYGCRHGNCSTCKYLVEDGDVELGAASAYSLPDQERDEGWALLCCAKPLSDLLIRDNRRHDSRALPQLRPIEQAATVAAITQLTPELWELRVALPAPLISYAGQFAELGVESVQGIIWRSYSMSSPPSATRELQFVIKRIDGGAFSGRINRLKPGDPLSVRGPFGASYLRAGNRPILLCAIGSGLAPVLSMLRDAAEKQDRRPFTLFYGARRPTDLPYLAELNDALGAHLSAGFRFIPTLDGLTPSDEWTRAVGTVTRAIQVEIDNAQALDAYLCGAPPMCDAVGRLLLAKGLPEHQLFFDRFFAASA